MWESTLTVVCDRLSLGVGWPRNTLLYACMYSCVHRGLHISGASCSHSLRMGGEPAWRISVLFVCLLFVCLFVCLLVWLG